MMVQAGPARVGALLLVGILVLAGCPEVPHATDDATDPDGGGERVGDAPGGGGDGGAGPTVDVPSGECSDDADCQPAGGQLPACRAIACIDAACALVDAPDGSACDDGDLCSTGDVCDDGVCGGSEALDCDDGNDCTTDACDADFGCVHTFNQKPCDDGSACSVADHCFQGQCTGDAVDCNDGNPCTDDACHPASGCSWVDNDKPCDDGDACTADDLCASGSCQAGAPLDCGAGNACVEAECDPAVGCLLTLIEGTCDDGNACTDADACLDGQCLGVLVVCDDGNLCTSDYCDEGGGCQHLPNALPCDDGEACTLGDVCSDAACTPGVPDPLCCAVDEGCDDGDACTEDACVAGYCSYLPKDCDDGFLCTADSCVGGACAHVSYGPLGAGQVFTADFEGPEALSGWEVVTNNPLVTWQLDALEVHGGGQSLYCGNKPAYTYDFGLTVASAYRVIAVPPGTSSLEFWIQQDLAETGSCNYDVTRVLVDGELLKPELCSSFASWTLQTYDLSTWSGMEATLELRFDTGDGIANNAGGVWIDDLAVVSEAIEGCCVVDADCAGGDGCDGELCDPESATCQVPAGDEACDDDDACTVDACGADASCSHEAIEGCCTGAAQCDDLDPCTEDVCAGLSCTYTELVGCCVTVADCPPPDPGDPLCEVPVCEDGACGVDASDCE